MALGDFLVLDALYAGALQSGHPCPARRMDPRRLGHRSPPPHPRSHLPRRRLPDPRLQRPQVMATLRNLPFAIPTLWKGAGRSGRSQHKAGTDPDVTPPSGASGKAGSPESSCDASTGVVASAEPERGHVEA